MPARSVCGHSSKAHKFAIRSLKAIAVGGRPPPFCSRRALLAGAADHRAAGRRGPRGGYLSSQVNPHLGKETHCSFDLDLLSEAIAEARVYRKVTLAFGSTMPWPTPSRTRLRSVRRYCRTPPTQPGPDAMARVVPKEIVPPPTALTIAEVHSRCPRSGDQAGDIHPSRRVPGTAPVRLSVRSCRVDILGNSYGKLRHTRNL